MIFIEIIQLVVDQIKEEWSVWKKNGTSFDEQWRTLQNSNDKNNMDFDEEEVNLFSDMRNAYMCVTNKLHVFMLNKLQFIKLQLKDN